jgi:hypothetical protein
MKNINFINTLTHQQQYALRRWWLLSLVLSLSVLLVVGVLHGLQVHQWYLLTTEYTALLPEVEAVRTVAHRHEALSTAQKKLQQKKAKADRVKQSLALVHTRLTHITSACQTVSLEQCKWHKNQVEILVGCPDAPSATRVVEQVRKIDGLNAARLVSLSPRDQGTLLATIKAQASV